MKFYLLLSFAICYSNFVSASWMEVQEDIIANYKSNTDLRKTIPEKAIKELIRGKYETISEFSRRLKEASARINGVKRFYLEYEPKFFVPDNNSIVTFKYTPFLERNISPGNWIKAKKFDTRWAYSYVDLNIDRDHLIQNNSDVVIIEIYDIDISDNSAFTELHDIDISDNSGVIISGKISAVGLYDKTNKKTLGVFSPQFEMFYHSYDGKIDYLVSLKTGEIHLNWQGFN